MLELGCNHQGDFDIARRMIDDAAQLDVYGVKLQVRDVELIPPDARDKKRDPATSFGDTYYTHRRALEFNDKQLTKLKEHAEIRSLTFAVSVFDLNSLKRAVEDLSIRHVKLPSQMYSNDAMCERLSSYRLSRGVFTMRSTGMHTTREVLAIIDKYEFDVTMYCRSIYPCTMLESDFGSARAILAHLAAPQRGYSSHDKNGEAIPWMILLGATMVERHYTLDKNMKGSDHHTVSSDFEDMKRVLEQVEQVEELLECKNMGSLASPVERANREFYMKEMQK